MGIENLRSAIDELVAMAPEALADPDTVLELSKQFDRFEAVVTRSAAAFDASGDWRPSRSRSAADWLAWQRHMPKATAARRVGLGRALRHMPVAEEAWLAGEIGSAHVVQLAKARTPATEEVFARDEKMLVDDAKELSYNGFHRTVAYWLQHADPNGAEDDAAAKYERRRFDLSRSFEDLWFGNLTLDAIGGTIIHDELVRLERELFEVDWAEARERLGREPGVHDLRRTPTQRRADALLEMATRSATAPADGRRPEPLFTAGGLGDLRRGDLRAGQPHGGHPRQPGALARPGLDRTGGVRVPVAGHGRGAMAAPLHRRHPPGCRGARPGVLPRDLRGAGRDLPDRPHRALRSRRRDRPGQRPARLRLPQPGPAPTTVATRSPRARGAGGKGER